MRYLRLPKLIVSVNYFGLDDLGVRVGGWHESLIFSFKSLLHEAKFVEFESEVLKH